MEHGSIFQDLVPLYHASLQCIERRILAVIDHTGVAHRHSLLEIISAESFAATHHMFHIQTELSQMHQGSITNLAIRQTSDILYLIA